MAAMATAALNAQSNRLSFGGRRTVPFTGDIAYRLLTKINCTVQGQPLLGVSQTLAQFATMVNNVAPAALVLDATAASRDLTEAEEKFCASIGMMPTAKDLDGLAQNKWHSVKFEMFSEIIERGRAYVQFAQQGFGIVHALNVWEKLCQRLQARMVHIAAQKATTKGMIAYKTETARAEAAKQQLTIQQRKAQQQLNQLNRRLAILNDNADAYAPVDSMALLSFDDAGAAIAAADGGFMEDFVDGEARQADQATPDGRMPTMDEPDEDQDEPGSDGGDGYLAPFAPIPAVSASVPAEESEEEEAPPRKPLKKLISTVEQYRNQYGYIIERYEAALREEMDKEDKRRRAEDPNEAETSREPSPEPDADEKQENSTELPAAAVENIFKFMELNVWNNNAGEDEKDKKIRVLEAANAHLLSMNARLKAALDAALKA